MKKLLFLLLNTISIFSLTAGNIISNGDFENSSSYWSIIGAPTYSIEGATNIVINGTGSAKIVTGTQGAATSQGLFQYVTLPANSVYTLSFKAKASANCSLQNILVQSYNPYGWLASSPIFALNTAPQTFSYDITSQSLTGLCKLAFYFGNLPAGTTIWLDDISLVEKNSLSNTNLCNGSFELTMNNALYTPGGYIYNFRPSGTSTVAENSIYSGWTKLKSTTVSDTATVLMDNSANKISGSQSLKYTLITNGTNRATVSTDHQFAWVFSGIKDRLYAIQFKAKSSTNCSIGVALSSWGLNYYLAEQTINLTTEVKTFTLMSTVPINLSDNRVILSFRTGLLPFNSPIWIDDVIISEGVVPTSVTVSPTQLSINRGANSQLSSTVLPIETALNSVTWSSDNPSIATVTENGLVAGISTGQTIIRVKTDLGNAVAAVTVNVSSIEDKSFYPAIISSSADDIMNPGRGFYKWNNFMEVAPYPTMDRYRRFDWAALEPSENNYQFDIIRNEAAYAAADPDRKGKFGFGFRCVVQGANYAYPSYLDAKMSSWYSNNKTCRVPDWNDPDFLERHDSLVMKLGREFNSDPRISFIEIRTYGNWGEWHLSGFEAPVAPAGWITTATIQHIIDVFVKAFPDKQIIMMSDNEIGLEYAMRKTGLKYPIGWRRDSWCNDGMRTPSTSSRYATAWPVTVDRWKTAPVIVESYERTGVTASKGPQQVIDFHVSAIGNGNFGDWTGSAALSDADKQSIVTSAKLSGYRYVLKSLIVPAIFERGKTANIRSTWANLGVAPTYEDWAVTFHLVDMTTNQSVWEEVSSLNLRNLSTYDFGANKDVPSSLDENFSVPSTLKDGAYYFEIEIADKKGYYTPLALANEGRQSNGNMRIGSVNVSAPLGVQATELNRCWLYLKRRNLLSFYLSNEEPYSILIYDAMGRLLQSFPEQQWQLGENELAIQTLAPGVHIIELRTKENARRFKVLVN